MKTKQFIFTASAFAIMVSCETKDANERYYEERKDKLEDFVDSVETVVNREANPNWTTLDSRYNRLTSDLRQAEDATSEKDRRDWQDLSERYEKAKSEAGAGNINRNSEMDRNTDTSSEAIMHMDRVESWNQRTATQPNTTRSSSTTTSESIEQSAEESMTWLEENFERLSADLQERYNKVKEDLKN